MTIKIDGAKSLDFSFDKFWLPDGGKFFIYNQETKEYIGAITNEFIQGNKENPSDFSTGIVLGEQITLEYYQVIEIKDKPIINISAVYYGYRYVNKNRVKGFGDSGNCQVNINCSEGVAWQQEKEAVARIYVKTPTGGGWCSGSLINNTTNNLEPLFLTANHCLDGVFDAINSPNLSQWIFYWHYEHPTCANSNTEPPIYSTVGATVKANNSVSDFALLELIQDPRNLQNFTSYYLGWDRTGNPGNGGVGIHHPKGDVKKISIDNEALSNYSSTIYWNNGKNSMPNTHWKSIIDKGTTEGGSAGFPLFNNNHKIIGQLLGGKASCENINGNDYYGCFDVSWTGNNNSSIYRRLDHWLDPLDTNTDILNGLFFKIDGPSTICNQATYTIANLPAGASVNWSSKNGNMILISGEGTANARFEAISEGSDEIECSIFLNSEQIATLNKQVDNVISEVSIYGSSMVGCGYTETYSSEVEGCTGIGYLWILKDKKTGDYIYKEGSSSLVISSTCDIVNTRQPINATHHDFEISLEVDFTDGSSKTSEPITVETFGIIELDSDLPPPPPTTPFLDISPNPATNSIQIGLLVTANNDLSDYIPSEVKIFNQQGIIVKTAALQSTTLNIPISDLQNGLYNVSLKARNGQIITGRFIKQ